MAYHDDAESIARAHASLERRYQRQLVIAPALDAALEAEEEAWLADVDTFQDWLSQYAPLGGAECAKHCHHTYVVGGKMTARDDDYIESLDPAQLMSLILQQPWAAHHVAMRLQALYLTYRRLA